ncbi:hypothetical protein K1719_033604 [Acacia pycnantha]|nr:hypothetical protein K1719_033604 [Acacia pycnantha]
MENNFYFASFDLEEDYSKALTGGPWMIFGAYLTVQPWSLDFGPSSFAISKVVAWVRLPRLSFRYYHKSTLRAIGTLLGGVVKIDYMMETRGRGKYACIAILIDLLKPLVPWIKVKYTRKGNEPNGGRVVKIGGSSLYEGSQFNVLFESDDMAASPTQLMPPNGGALKSNLQGSSRARSGTTQVAQEYKKKTPQEAPTNVSPLKPNSLVVPPYRPPGKESKSVDLPSEETNPVKEVD